MARRQRHRVTLHDDRYGLVTYEGEVDGTGYNVDVLAAYANGDRLSDRVAARLVEANSDHLDYLFDEQMRYAERFEPWNLGSNPVRANPSARYHRQAAERQTRLANVSADIEIAMYHRGAADAHRGRPRANPEDLVDLMEVAEMDAIEGSIRRNPCLTCPSDHAGYRRNGMVPTSVDVDTDISREHYPGIFGDYDRDGVPNADDAYPVDPSRRLQVEEVRLADEVGHLIDLRRSLVSTLDAFEAALGAAFPGRHVYGRVKTPYSILNKLRRKRLLDRRKGLTDLIATTVVAEDGPDLRRIARNIETGMHGEVLDKDDFYALPGGLNGYRAIHYIVDFPDPTGPGSFPVEIQVKTKRQQALSAASHTAYKTGRMNADVFDRYSTLAMRADEGDRAAAAQIDPLLPDTASLVAAISA